MGKHKPPITEAFKQMREEFGDIFADIKDVDAFCHEVRYGDMSKDTPDYDTLHQHVEQADTLQGAAPMPEEVERLFQSADWGPMPKLALAALREAFTALARRLAEVEGERDALLKREDLLERTLDDKWRTRKYIVCREYQLVDMMCITMTVMDWYDAEKARAEAAEAKVQRIMEWARSDCYKERVCGNAKKGMCVTVLGNCKCGNPGGTLDNWTPPKEWEGE